MVINKTWQSRAADWMIILIISMLSLLCIAPLWLTVAVSFSDKAAVAAGMVTWRPVGFNLLAYQKLLEDSHFFRAFGISLQRIALGCTINFVLTALMAYPLSRSVKQFKHRNVIMWFIVFTMMFSGGFIPWFMTIKSYHLLDTIWALVLPGAVPVFSVILLMNFFRSIPKELEEAGEMDGAGPWYMLLRIYLPLSVPALATITLFSIVGHWNSFFDGLILMNKPANYPLQTYIQQLVVQINMDEVSPENLRLLAKLSNKTLNAAKIIISMIPILLVYPFLQRYFIHGIMLGSVKE
ncbi:carbohydrate ABC transporter permease [Paenibacillus eucommiae]|uniref:ABC-type glycerol-3-phosphate transport system permease component n=1 Tax=Paenibacillus eucommiae TaxID=1355755 RepID=A0ABS4J865_9BACL|nr:carbohydrate ABC transporter permease [Paenibacillus eucommiae]MBP1996000.1 ABC-type glycerol-3-phosphate transport system permease component [Paenibacillus eucommiae]